jgi:hypothetical protein
MGHFKKLTLFCQIHELDPKLKSSQDFYEVSTKLGLSTEQEAAMIARGGFYSPCLHCGAMRSRRSGQANWHCFYCGRNQKANTAGEDTRVDRELERVERLRRQQLAFRLWDESVSIINTEGERYLAARRLELPPDPDAVLRWHPSCNFGRDQLPCMVALFRDAITDQPVGIHRTHIEYGRAERMALGPIARAAIKLWPLGESEELAVGEGIETVMSALKLGHAKPPAWATGVANNLSKLPVIKSVRKLTVVADNDLSRTGEVAARELRRKWASKEVVIRMPAQSGMDFNDLLRSAS